MEIDSCIYWEWNRFVMSAIDEVQMIVRSHMAGRQVGENLMRLEPDIIHAMEINLTVLEHIRLILCAGWQTFLYIVQLITATVVVFVACMWLMGYSVVSNPLSAFLGGIVAVPVGYMIINNLRDRRDMV